MEIKQIDCLNLGMARDEAISESALSGSATIGGGKMSTGVKQVNYAFENKNIRILAVNDSTKFAITNEKSTAIADWVCGHFMGSCLLNKHLVVFIKDLTSAKQDYIYRFDLNEGLMQHTILYNGNLGFDLAHPIEAVGYYESEDVQKVYWVDGLNSNRFINIVYEPEQKFIVAGDPSRYVLLSSYKIIGQSEIQGLGFKNDEAVYYTIDDYVWRAEDVEAYLAVATNPSIQGLNEAYPSLSFDESSPVSEYSDTSFDFQGSVDNIPSVKITKNYNESGTFQAGTLQYFMTYYNKYGVETCIIWSSDLQYLSISDRGAKADESVICGFDFEITNIDASYDYIRVYSCYRSGLDGDSSAKIVTDLPLEKYNSNSIIKFSDLGTTGETYDAQNLPYVGGQNIIANTLDYKQDTLFLGDITIDRSLKDSYSFSKHDVTVDGLTDESGNNVTIKEGALKVNDSYTPFVTWAYKYVSPIAKSGVVYQYDQEIKNSQKEIAGFKWRELYRFGIQFMDAKGTWTSAYWIGDKYCDLKPRVFNYDSVHNKLNGTTNVEDSQFGYFNAEVEESNGKYHTAYVTDNGVTFRKRYNVYPVYYKDEGCYIAQAVVNISAIESALGVSLSSKYLSYRLLVAEPNLSNRRIVQQGVINPTMFNYADRYYNKPFAIPSYIFRPRNSKIANKHYDTLPLQGESNAEIQGIVTRKVPGNEPIAGVKYNAYVFVFAVNEISTWTGAMQWKLIYYNAGNSDKERKDLAYLAMYTDEVDSSASADDLQKNRDKVAELIVSYNKNRNGYNKIALRRKPSTSFEDTGSSSYVKLWNDSGDDYTKEQILALLNTGKYLPTAVYGTSYKVISARFSKTHTKGSMDPESWASLEELMIEKLQSDMKNTSVDEVGSELAGKLVLTPATLPTAEDIEDIAKLNGNDAKEIGLAILAVVIAAAAAVVSAVTFGTTAPAMAVVATIGIQACVSALSAGAIGVGAAAAVSSLAKEDLSDITKRMLSLGYFACGTDKCNLKNRRSRSGYIAQILEKYFCPRDYYNNTNNHAVSSDYRYEVPVLVGECEDGNVEATPFRTANPYTKTGYYLGENYNAYATTGILNVQDEDDSELNKKQNLFCIDESIVTLNSPDVEDLSSVINNSEALKLDLVGVIPISANYGTYDLQVSSGYNSNSQVVYSKLINQPVGKLNGGFGLLTANLYQDFKANETIFDDDNPSCTVSETVGLYKTFMWERNTSAGFWFPGVSTKDAFGQDITSPKSVIQNKIFANLRYSTNSQYYEPYSMSIDAPQTCLDDQVMLKNLKYGGTTKAYYENVDMISVNDESYPLIVDNTFYPSTSSRISKCGIKDPIAIKYKETPNTVIPLKWSLYNTSATILPYIGEEGETKPNALYPSSGNVKFFGTTTALPKSSSTYYYIETDECDSTDDDADPWNLGWETDDSLNYLKLQTLSNILNPTSGWYAVAKNLAVSQETDIDTVLNSAYMSSADMKLLKDYAFWILDTSKTYLLRTSKTHYYMLTCKVSQGSAVWHCNRIEYLIANDTVVVFSNASTAVGSGIFRTFKGEYSDGNYYIYPVNDSMKLKTPKMEYWNVIKPDVHYWSYYESSAVPTTANYSVAIKKYALNNIVEGCKILLNVAMDSLLKDYADNGGWTQDKLDWDVDSSIQYLFLGELVKKAFDYDTWNGGTSDIALTDLNWIVASGNTPISQNVKASWGDTFYQRWDCEKTYPFTEAEKNSNVEVLSFMLESHSNLDGRCDVNRGINNLINLRPANTIYNNAYNQQDNFFNYQVLDEKFERNRFEADVVWSLTKNSLDVIDKWTCLLATNEMSLDGRYGTLRKILNVNDNLVGFQDTGMAQIKYNESAALSTTSGLPVQIGNSGKVNGYRMLSDTVGCHNKFSISKNSTGVYFADDFNKTFNKFTIQGGLSDISATASFSMWFKEHLNGTMWDAKNRSNYRASYDEITHDLYLSKYERHDSNQACLVYNTLIERFTSFMDYVDTPLITRMIDTNGEIGSYAFRQTVTGQNSTPHVEIWKLFAGSSDDNASPSKYGEQGEYGYIYGSFKDYYIDYRICPDADIDNIFTNYQYTADWITPTSTVNNPDSFGEVTLEKSADRRYTSFDEVWARNDYQEGRIVLDTERVSGPGRSPIYNRLMGKFPIKSKFRIWRGDIPRDEDGNAHHNPLADRMRNPWIKLRFTKNQVDDSKMTFHNLIVTYYNQHGRY